MVVAFKDGIGWLGERLGGKFTLHQTVIISELYEMYTHCLSMNIF